MKSVKDVMTNLKPPSSSYQISNSANEIIECEEGTSIYIPANSFVLKNGSVPKGNITITIKECYGLASIIGEGLHTESQGKILESAGMIKIIAKADGQKLEIKKGKAIQIGFPKKKKSNQEMDLFYLAESTWVPDYKMFELNQPMMAEGSDVNDGGGDLEYPIDVTEDMYDYFLDCTGGNSESLFAIISGTNKDMWHYLEDQRNSKVDFAKEFYENGYNFWIDFNIDPKGKMYNFRLLPHNNETHYQDFPKKYTTKAVNKYIDYLKKLPAFEISSFEDGINPEWDYGVGVSASQEIDWQKFKRKFREQFKENEKTASKKFNKRDLDYYIFSVTELGWINCDAFLDIPEDQKTDFVVKVPENIEQKVRLIFDNNGGERTVMNGQDKKGETIFRGVPINQSVTIVGISYSDANPSLSRAKVNISKNGFELKSFKKISIDELEKELNGLN